MKLKDVRPGSRILIDLVVGRDFCNPLQRDIDCQVVATFLRITSGKAFIGFRKGERESGGVVQCVSGEDRIVDSLVDGIDLLKPSTQCQPAYNRRFLR
jgi:hypothetical protein